ncbi:MAG: ATP-binding cassette domain-containing protein [Phenylobacterium sp.]|jgi:ABC-2 type transport system ATP-binding protein|uniref:ABC transporter ATP-binding protein n=1 Tax=Phenylobacterium sp. TaxID=1871053 RepID=UPI0025F694DF|nr:ATP-binding cassette domain-containing protein [Phenylobacterium sp.]MCA3715643.1 ATP-binding cassette domain-containing protein [Phenylobacterium sp.]MCA3728048.1 ATP-binding cassette domain-containing protein [Phenylobacterium sp.]MCA3735773.1 ATP-binding cassette domain-containing protein [Phenylobacterium sp.]MCA6242613.1 ATP-binding cassette domain-containing protein [Phenylobacterium sp.]MCA6247804.1 ATP-binding cassette domain-containing protein [Phenylobacterium sp.]
MADAPALELTDVTRRFGDRTVVDQLSFRVARGAVFGFLGPNGAGKTTTLRMILGLVAPTSGRLTVLGAADGRRVRDRIGFLPEERGLHPRMTPLQAAAFLGALKGVPARAARQKARSLLEGLGLGASLNTQIRRLSKGMAQQVALVCTLVHDPELLILDEPFSGLDPGHQQALEILIRERAAAGATVVFSTHVMSHAERLCDQVVLLAKGRKVFDGTVPQARSQAPGRLILEGDLTPEAISALPGVAEVAASDLPEGRRLEVWLAPGMEAHQTLSAAFRAGLPVRRFESREPGLHEAFLLLTGARAALPEVEGA